jgi:mannosyl-oligosaccharide glucosidase
MASHRVRSVSGVFLAMGLLAAAAILAEPSSVESDRDLARVPLWGTYRPHALMSVRARVPHSPFFGVSYHPAASAEVRHLAADHQGAIRTFGFSRHDGRSFGDHVIEDGDVNAYVRYSYFLHESGDAWVLRLSGEQYDERKGPEKISLVVHASAGAEEIDAEATAAADKGKEGPWGTIDLSRTTQKTADGVIGDCILEGRAKSIGGSYRLFVREPTEGNILEKQSGDSSDDGIRRRRRTRLKASQYGPDLSRFHIGARKRDVKESFMVDSDLRLLLLEAQDARMQAQAAMDDGTSTESPRDLSLTLPNVLEENSPTVLVQRILKVPFRMDIVFAMTESRTDDEIAKLVVELSGDNLDQELERRRKSFDTRFDFLFGLRQLGYSQLDSEFARAALANTLGGIGYFYGGTPVHASGGTELRDPLALFTSTPSRALFPRGFLWDEGFHQLLIQKWDAELSRACLVSWFKQMEPSGWIPREQVLGSEARARFPAHVQHLMVQMPTVANPPTILMPLRVFAGWEKNNESISGNDDAADTKPGGSCTVDGGGETSVCHAKAEANVERDMFWATLLDKAVTNFRWLMDTQAGSSPHSFRWRGRDSNMKSPEGYPLTLASGLDDYPRGFTANDNERHVDLHSWVTWGAGALAALHGAADRPSVEFDALRYGLLDALEGHHRQQGLDASSKTHPELLCDYDGERSICEEGYVTALPLLLGLLDVNSPRVDAVLGMLEDRNVLRSPAGVRSLSRQSELYRKGDDYWTGSVWMPFNYLTLAALYTKYGNEEGPYRERAKALYDSLKIDVLQNARTVFENTGFLWENYSPDDGRGKSGRQFTGWSSLVVLIYGDIYDGVL